MSEIWKASNEQYFEVSAVLSGSQCDNYYSEI